MSAATEIVSLLRLLVALDPLAKEGVECTLSVELVERADANRFILRYEAAPRGGPFAAVELRVPAAGATSEETMLNLEVRKDAFATEDEIDRALGHEGEIVDINPHKPPEGTVSYRHLLDQRTVVVQCTARSKRLVGISLRAATP